MDKENQEKKNFCRGKCGRELPRFQFWCPMCQRKNSSKLISKRAMQAMQSKPPMRNGGNKGSFES